MFDQEIEDRDWKLGSGAGTRGPGADELSEEAEVGVKSMMMSLDHHSEYRDGLGV